MRRPPPLPAAADDPEETADEVRSGAFRMPLGRRARPADQAAPPSEPAQDPVPSDVLETVELSDVVAPVADGGSRAAVDAEPPADVTAPSAAAPDRGEGRPLTSADVWRAARARRKALRAEIRRFTQRSRRRRAVWWGSIGAVVALVLGTLVAAYSPLFAVQKVTVAGAKALDAEAVESALAGQVGTPLALVDRSEVKSALLEFPLIETYSIELRPPHELLVRVVERTPIGVVKTDAGYSLLDAAGVVLSTTPQRPDGAALLEISGGPDSDAFASAGLVMRSLPAELRKTVTGVTASSVDDVTLTLEGDRTVVWGNAEQSARKAYTLDKLIAARPDATSYDVSSPDVAVVG